MNKKLFGIKKRLLAMLCAAAISLPFITSSVSAEEPSATTFTQVEGTMLYMSEKSSCADVLTKAYWSVPFNVLQKLVASNCKIYVVTAAEKDREYTNAFGYPAGSYPTGMYSGTVKESRIDILQTEALMKDSTAVVHEIGHFMDNNSAGGYAVTGTFYYASSTPEWQSIYKAERSAIMTVSRSASANCYNAVECFASTFADYVLHPAALQKAAPRAYAYMDACVKAF